METPVAFAPLSKRLAALLLDSVFIAFYFALTLMLISSLSITSKTLESLLIIGICLSIEPCLVAFSGATLGQHVLKLKVRKLAKNKKLNILQAYWRSVTKIIFGLPSLLTVLSSRKHQAIHDMLAASIVVLNAEGVSKASYILREREDQTELYHYPSVWRRLVMMIVYIGLLFLAMACATYFLFGDACLDYRRCSDWEQVLNFFLSAGFWIALFVLINYCWKARMPGCQRKPREARE